MGGSSHHCINFEESTLLAEDSAAWKPVTIHGVYKDNWEDVDEKKAFFKFQYRLQNSSTYVEPCVPTPSTPAMTTSQIQSMSGTSTSMTEQQTEDTSSVMTAQTTQNNISYGKLDDQ